MFTTLRYYSNYYLLKLALRSRPTVQEQDTGIDPHPAPQAQLSLKGNAKGMDAMAEWEGRGLGSTEVNTAGVEQLRNGQTMVKKRRRGVGLSLVALARSHFIRGSLRSNRL